jgi:PIN like domain
VPRILLDHNVPRPLRRALPGHEVRTTAEMGWERLTNGELLDAAEREGFEVFVTGDQNIRQQQDLSRRRIALVVLSTTYWPTVRARLDRIASAVTAAAPGTYAEVELETVRTRRPRGPSR